MRRGRHEHVPQAFGARLFLQFFQDRDHLPALALGVLLIVDRHRGPDMLVHERFHTIEPFALTVRHVEVHWAFLTFLGENLWRHCLPTAPRSQDYSWPADICGSDDGRSAWDATRNARIDIPRSQTIVSYNCLKCNAPNFCAYDP